jgi:hypothetical protein
MHLNFFNVKNTKEGWGRRVVIRDFNKGKKNVGAKKVC